MVDGVGQKGNQDGGANQRKKGKKKEKREDLKISIFFFFKYIYGTNRLSFPIKLLQRTNGQDVRVTNPLFSYFIGV